SHVPGSGAGNHDPPRRRSGLQQTSSSSQPMTDVPGAGGAGGVVVGSVVGGVVVGSVVGGFGSTLRDGATEVDVPVDGAGDVLVPVLGAVVPPLGAPVVGVMWTMPLGSTEMPGAGDSDAG